MWFNKNSNIIIISNKLSHDCHCDKLLMEIIIGPYQLSSGFDSSSSTKKNYEEKVKKNNEHFSVRRSFLHTFFLFIVSFSFTMMTRKYSI